MGLFGQRGLAIALSLAAGLATRTVATEGALPLPVFGATDGAASVLLANADGRSPYAGIVRYVGRAQCTGVFVDTVSSDRASRDAPAYVLTNGHCADFPGANDVIADRPAPSTHRVVFNYFADTRDRQLAVSVRTIAYATMKGRDLAVLELAERHDEIVRRGFEPWPMTGMAPLPNEPVIVVGAPLTGSEATSFLRLAACRLESRAPVVIEFVWHWFDAARNRCADIAGGSSGSPVISRRTGRLVGLVNTTTRDAVPFTDCAINHPCEPIDGDVTSRVNTTYMAALAGVASCFDERGRFARTSAGCPLDPGVQAVATPAVLGAENPGRLPGLSGPPRRNWNVTVSGPFDHYRYKVVKAASGDCRDWHGYGTARRVGDRPLIDDPLPAAEGVHLLCVVGGIPTRRGTAWQRFDHPTVVMVRIDSTPPRIPARITVTEGELGWRVAFATVSPEIAGYVFKFGRPGEIRCESAADYRPALVPFVFLAKANRPYLFCAIPQDAALNPGTTFEVLLP